jgi:hypothetical protein
LGDCSSEFLLPPDPIVVEDRNWADLLSIWEKGEDEGGEQGDGEYIGDKEEARIEGRLLWTKSQRSTSDTISRFFFSTVTSL